jgi:predicted nucleic acid-binding protein
LVLDSGGLTALAEGRQRARSALEMSQRTGTPVVVPAIVIAESTRGDGSDAPVNRVLNKLSVVSIDENGAREAARLKRAAGMTGVEHTIDALVVAVATLGGGGAILTSDVRDIAALASARTGVAVTPIRV